MDAVTVYLAYVEVLAHGSDVGGGDVVGGAPDAVGGGFVGVGQRVPVLLRDQRYHAAGCFWCAAVVLTRLPKPPNIAFYVPRYTLV